MAVGEAAAPLGLTARLWSWRYLLLRRVTQASILALFWGTAHRGWEVAGRPLLSGNLSASELLGSVPLADPLAVAQLLLIGGGRTTALLAGAAIVLLFYALVGGRSFCSWVCPVNPVTDLAGWLRRKLDLPPDPRGGDLALRRSTRHWLLGLTLVLTPLLGLAAFEWVSPVGMVQRGLVFGLGAGWLAALAIFAFDLLAVPHGWCGHLCPLGAFYGLLGRTSQVRVRFDDASCTRCGDCVAVCPEPWVLDFTNAAETGMIGSGDCTNCGRCTPICPEGSLAFAWRGRIRPAAGQ